MQIKTFAKALSLGLLVVGTLSACSDQKTEKSPTSSVKVTLKPTAPAKSVTKMVPVESAKAVEKLDAQQFVTAFGHGTLKIMQETSGPSGLTAVIVAPSGTKVVTPTTPIALLWVMPGGSYAMEGTLLDVAGKNLSLKYREKMGIVPPSLMSEPASPPVAGTASAMSAMPAKAPVISNAPKPELPAAKSMTKSN